MNLSSMKRRPHQILEDVRNRFSDIGILYMSQENESVLTKLLEEYDLQFYELLCASPHVFLRRGHPLAQRPLLKLEDLKPYPRLSFVQGNYESAYFSEELFSTVPAEKNIKVSDRAGHRKPDDRGQRVYDLQRISRNICRETILSPSL